MRIQCVILLLFAVALTSYAVDEGFKPYQIILDKSPFGEEPAEEEIRPISINQSFAKNIRLSMLYEGPSGDIRVGIVDSETKKNHILIMDEEVDGFELIDADLDAEEAMIRKGNEQALFKLKGAPEPVPAGRATPKKPTYTARRNARQAAQKPEEPAAPVLTGEALRQHLEEVQMDAIRTGKPPLPMALTPEMDAQLVAEGVLDPL